MDWYDDIGWNLSHRCPKPRVPRQCAIRWNFWRDNLPNWKQNYFVCWFRRGWKSFSNVVHRVLLCSNATWGVGITQIQQARTKYEHSGVSTHFAIEKWIPGKTDVGRMCDLSVSPCRPKEHSAISSPENWTVEKRAAGWSSLDRVPNGGLLLPVRMEHASWM